MKIIAPNYYKKFHCIANKCRHNCCLGWEIDIDEDSLQYYRTVPGKIGEKLRNHISLTEGCAHFQLEEGERCPFLDEQNLCELITNLGEQSLCQICTDHPRFRNYWSDCTEIGLGLACEQAARIILSQQEKVTFELIDKDEQPAEEMLEDEREIYNQREEIYTILKNRQISVDQRIIEMMNYCGYDSSNLHFEKGPLNEIACEQLAVYLVFRNYADVMYDDRIEDRIRFVAENYCLIRNQWALSGKTDVESLIEPARLFSQKVEYDTDTWGIEE